MKIVVLCGGTSTERDISIVSGTEVCHALRDKGHAAILLDVFFGDEEASLMNAFPEYYDVSAAASYIKRCDASLPAALANKNRNFFGPNVIKLCKMADIVFLALHGANGEDGKVQAAFDLQKIRYTGTGMLSSAISMDKVLTKIMLELHGIKTPYGVTLSREKYTTVLDDKLHFPVVVKVACGGSSVGVYIAEDQASYEEALVSAFALEDTVLVEEYVNGREFSVGVIDGKALPVIEISPKQGFYDYDNKYTPGAVTETCPAEIPSALTRNMQKMSEDGYHALRIETYARFDYMMNDRNELFCLEVNTLPGMTPTSLIPQEAAAVGMDFGELCERIIEVSMEKYK